MTRTFTIAEEIIDVDVCYGDYDSFVSKPMFYVTMFENGECVDGCGFITEDDAKEHGQQFVETI